MDTPPAPRFTKEMIDLMMRVKKHLKAQGIQTELKLSDPRLFDKLLALDSDIPSAKNDPLLNGMLTYLMALAGPEWTAAYENRHATPETEKKSRTFYRGVEVESDEADSATPGEQASAEATGNKTRKPLRYYRGQPIYE